jgi:polyribonucleotide nucleotidyltransferase
MIGASAALCLSGVPFQGPVGACRVGYSDGKFVLNPPSPSDALDLVVAGTADGILMVESEASELPESVVLDAVLFGFNSFQPVIKMVEKLRSSFGRPQIDFVPLEETYAELFSSMENAFSKVLSSALCLKNKSDRAAELGAVKKEVLARYPEYAGPEIISLLLDRLLSRVARAELLLTNTRVDGRGLEDVRPISCSVGLLPKVHGSSLFTRGGTQAVVVTTLGSADDEQIMDDISGDSRQKYILHYNFPPYSVGEIGKIGAPGRREVGHGKLAWRATYPLLKKLRDFPYTVRVVSEVLESDGSSSMATVCGASLSMMEAGVPLPCGVAGIAMGLVKHEDRILVLSDILGLEDHFGDMDFKVAGTSTGITALQMDLKITGIGEEVLRMALDQAKKGRLHILEIMNETITKGRESMKPCAPRFEKIFIDKDRIRDVIGAGGKTIKDICEKTQTKIDVEDDGSVLIFSPNQENLDKAIRMVRSAGCPPAVGEIFTGKVVKITEFGAFVNIGGPKEGLVHISNIANYRVRSVDDVLSVGQEVRVKILGIDEKGKIKLTMKGV